MKTHDHAAQLAEALKSVVEWTGDTATMPQDSAARLEWYARRLLMIRNACRPAIAAWDKHNAPAPKQNALL